MVAIRALPDATLLLAQILTACCLQLLPHFRPTDTFANQIGRMQELQSINIAYAESWFLMFAPRLAGEAYDADAQVGGAVIDNGVVISHLMGSRCETAAVYT